MNGCSTWTACIRPMCAVLIWRYPTARTNICNAKFQFFSLNFAGILGRKMANLMTGKSTMTGFRNNRAEEHWSSLHPEMKILVSFHKSLLCQISAAMMSWVRRWGKLIVYYRLIPKICEWAKYQNRHSSKNIWVMNLFFCQNYRPIRWEFWQKSRFITHVLFELCLFWYLAHSQILGISL